MFLSTLWSREHRKAKAKGCDTIRTNGIAAQAQATQQQERHKFGARLAGVVSS
jgi:hypothetical protein